MRVTNGRFGAPMANRFQLVAVLVVMFGSCFLSPALSAQQTVVTLDPAHTTIDFTLGATLHTVHGTFKLKSGSIQFDPATGKAGGSIVVDVTSGNTGDDGRDSKMHKDILESQKFPEAVFAPAMVKSQTPGIIPTQGSSQVDVSGVFRLHGQDHPMTLTFSVTTALGGQVQASAQFKIPYIQWGLKSPNTFFLHVSDTLDMTVQAAGHVSSASSHP
jgi:polyisoprenoid-binding protein YceI